jgi:hypothetical protein
VIEALGDAPVEFDPSTTFTIFGAASEKHCLSQGLPQRSTALREKDAPQLPPKRSNKAQETTTISYHVRVDGQHASEITRTIDKGDVRLRCKRKT